MPLPSGATSLARSSCFAFFLAVSASPWAAPLDLAPDAVLGKDSFVAPAGAAASATHLAGPAQAAEDPVEGTLWVADFGANRVLRYASASAFANGEAANLVLGQPDFAASTPNRGGPPGPNTLSGPVGVAVDQADRVYVSEDGNHRILVFRPPFANGMDAFAVIGQADFGSGAANRGGVVATNTMNHPRHLALDSQGELVVADSGNHRVLRFRAPAVTGAAAYRVHGQTGPGATASALNAPHGVAIGADARLWIADTGNHRVVRIDRIGNATADLVLCQASFTAATPGTAADACAAPAGVAVDTSGAVYVADSENSRVLRFASPAVGASATAVIGQGDFASGACNAGAGVTASTLCNPGAVAMDRDGNVLVSDAGNGRVLRLDLPAARGAPVLLETSPAVMPEGGGPFTLTVNGLFLHGGSVVHWDGSPLATQYLSSGRLVAQVSVGQLAAGRAHEVTVVTPSPGGGVSAAKQLLAYPRAPLDASADRVLGQFDFGPPWVPASQWVGEERLGGTNAAQVGGIPAHAVVDPLSGRLFVASVLESRVMSWPSARDFHNAQSADVILGAPDAFAGSACTDPATTFCGPVGLAVDGSGALYVADSGSHRVLRFAPPFATGMAATQVFGQAGSLATRTENKGGISADSLSAPLGIAASGTTLFVHDYDNSRLLVFNDAATDATADVVIGQADMQSVVTGAVDATRISGGAGSGTAVPTSRWGGLAVDGAGRLYFADGSLNRILRFSPPFSNGMAADLVIGQPGFGTSAPGTAATMLDGPAALAVDAGGGLVVADSDNNRVLRYAAPLQAGMAATGVLGQAGFDTKVTGSGPAASRTLPGWRRIVPVVCSWSTRAPGSSPSIGPLRCRSRAVTWTATGSRISSGVRPRAPASRGGRWRAHRSWPPISTRSRPSGRSSHRATSMATGRPTSCGGELPMERRTCGCSTASRSRGSPTSACSTCSTPPCGASWGLPT
jgi:sugar lactone lactonase YvrE